MKIIDGYTGQPHWTSQQTANFHMATIAAGNCVLPYGNMFAYDVVDNNTITIRDGMLLLQGRRVCIDYGEVDTCAIDNGVQGAQRSDLIVCRYQKDNVSHVESTSLVVVKGTNGQGDPVINDATDICGGAGAHDFALYRIRLDGISIVGVDTLFERWRSGPTETEAFLLAHPVGSLYETTREDESASSKMAAKYGGAWEVFGAGRVTVGVYDADADYNEPAKTGGAKTSSTPSGGSSTSGSTTLTAAQMPRHLHSITSSAGFFHTSGNGYNHSNAGSTVVNFGGTATMPTNTGYDKANAATGHTHSTPSHTHSAQSVVQPYITVYRYIRTE